MIRILTKKEKPVKGFLGHLIVSLQTNKGSTIQSYMNAEKSFVLVELYQAVMLFNDTAHTLYTVAVSVTVIVLCGVELRVILKNRSGYAVLAEYVLIITRDRKLKGYAWSRRAFCSFNGIIENVAE